MKGTIKAYSPAVNAGTITNAEGKTYSFDKAQWSGKDLPVNNEPVTFTDINARAIEVKGE